MRWAPSALQLADALTKPAADPADTLRGVMRGGRYQIFSEEKALSDRAVERQRRKELGEQRQRETQASAV